MNTDFWALLIGIDNYATAPRLKGCINDVEAIKIFLVDQLGVPEDQICVLKDDQATRSEIIRVFQDFLINNSAIKCGSQILFHYSGHGSRMRDYSGVEPDGYNETIVPYDSRLSGIFDIPDKTLAALLDHLASNKGDNITVVLDSCHSGSGTRDIEDESTVKARLIPPDDRVPPSNLDYELIGELTMREAGSRGWINKAFSHVLLAGCRDREKSFEYRIPDGKNGFIYHGALTYFLLECLKQIDSPFDITYSELHERVAARVNTIYPSQMPQCEVDRNRVVFGGKRINRDTFIRVEKVDASSIVLGAGLIHGLHIGTELALYPPEVRTRAALQSAEPLAMVEIVSVSATSSQAMIQNQTAKSIPLHSRGLITRRIYTGLLHLVALKSDESDASKELMKRLRQIIEPSETGGEQLSHIQITETPSEKAYLKVCVTNGKFSIYNVNSELLVPSEMLNNNGNDEVALVNTLESIFRYRSFLMLGNQESGSRLTGKIKLRMRQFVKDTSCQEKEFPLLGNGSGGLIIPFYSSSRERNLYIVDLINESNLEIYPYVFILNPNYSIVPLYPLLGQQEALRAGGTLQMGLNSPMELLEVYLPDEPGCNSSRDILKVVVTTVPSDLSILKQGGLNVAPSRRGVKRPLNSPLEQLLDIVVNESGLRYARPNRTSVGDDWATMELPYTVVRKL